MTDILSFKDHKTASG